MWLHCHGDSEYRLDDDQWLRGVSMKQLVVLHEQPAGLIPIPPINYIQGTAAKSSGLVAMHKCFSLSRTSNSYAIVFLAGTGAKILLTTDIITCSCPCVELHLRSHSTHIPIQPALNR